MLLRVNFGQSGNFFRFLESSKKVIRIKYAKMIDFQCLFYALKLQCKQIANHVRNFFGIKVGESGRKWKSAISLKSI